MQFDQAMHYTQSILKTAFAAQKQPQSYVRVHARFAAGLARFRQILQAFAFVSMDPANPGHDLDCHRQAGCHVIVDSHHRLGIHKAGLKFQHLLMVATGAQSVAQP